MGLSQSLAKIQRQGEAYPSHVVTSKWLSSLTEIYRPEVNLGIVGRCLPYGLKGVLQLLLGNVRPLTLRASVKRNFEEKFRSIFQFLLEKDSRDSRWLFEDIFSLSLRFAELSKSACLDIQLEVVGTNQCRKFHTDNTGLRLICTYIGPSTQWIENSRVDRMRLGSDAFDEELKSTAPVRQLRTGDVAILKGEAFPQNLGNGLVHKSPEIENTQTKRLVLRIDTYLGEL